MLGLVEYVLRDKDDANIKMTTAFRIQMAHKSAGIGVVQQVVQYEYTGLSPHVFKFQWHAFVITDVQI
jgi:hypothetical protein